MATTMIMIMMMMMMMYWKQGGACRQGENGMRIELQLAQPGGGGNGKEDDGREGSANGWCLCIPFRLLSFST